MTHIQRLDSILTGMLDVAPTNAQTLKVADAFVSVLSDSEILAQFGVARGALTNPQKAQIAVTGIRNEIKAKVRESLINASVRANLATVEALGNTAISDL